MSNKIEGHDKKLEEQKQGLSSLQSEMQGVKKDLENINTKLQEHTQKLTDIRGNFKSTQKFGDIKNSYRHRTAQLIGLKKL